jgi:phosphopantetheinyl transferase
MPRRRAALTDGVVVEVVVVRLEDLRRVSPEGLAQLCTAEERERAAGIPLQRNRERAILSRGLLRLLLAERLDVGPDVVTLLRDRTGKLRSGDDADLRFNVSASRDTAVYAFRYGAEVGVDVEAMDPRLDVCAIARQFFPPAEEAELMSAPESERRAWFHRSWCRKEALLKAQGSGLRRVMHEIAAPSCAHVAIRPAPFPGEPGWAVCDLDVAPGHAAAVASQGTGWLPVVRLRAEVSAPAVPAPSGIG